MKKILFYSCFLFVFCFSTKSLALTGGEEEREKIIHFDAAIKIDSTGKVRVTETIKVRVLGEEIKRGITRSLPLKRNLNKQRQTIKYTVLSIEKNNQPEPYHTQTQNEHLLLFTGSQNRLLEPGIYEYKIQYETQNQIGFFEEYDEFYWNVNGNQGVFQTDSISATVSLPTEAVLLQNACYTGRSGSTDKNCQVEILNSHEIQWAAAQLFPGEGLTIAVGFEKGLIPAPPPPSFIELYGVSLFLAIAFLSGFILCFRQWKKHGIDPPKPTVFPQFRIPENLSPGAMGYLYKEYIAPKSISASLVNLAVKGYVKIEEQNTSKSLFGKAKTYTLHKIKNAGDTLAEEEQKILLDLFQSSDSLTIDGAYDSTIKKATDNYHKNLRKAHAGLLKKGTNLRKLTRPILLLMFSYIVGLVFSGFLVDDSEYVIIGVFSFFFTLFATGVMMFIVNRGIKMKTGFFSYLFLSVGILFALGIALVLFFVMLNSSLPLPYKAGFVFLALSSGLLILFAYLIKRPAEEKLHIQSLIEGFKMYLTTAEEKRLQLENPPEFTPELFEKYLAYALVLDVEKIWGDRFQHLLNSTSIDYQNTWYSGENIATGIITSHLAKSLTHSIASSSVTPSSSSGGSYRSGSGGGGFSGGGGGGGGVGGW